jgi:hypothetical protein
MALQYAEKHPRILLVHPLIPYVSLMYCILTTSASGYAMQYLQVALRGVPPALMVCCNGNYGFYMVARRAIQCMCAHCQGVRKDPRCAEWLVSPTEYERHSGMPSAKKWRYRWAAGYRGRGGLDSIRISRNAGSS